MNKMAVELYKIAADLKKDAGLWDKIKRGVATAILGLASMFVVDEEAKAAKITDPEAYGKQIEQVLHDDANREDITIKVSERTKGIFQIVKMEFLAGDEKIGTIDFLGSTDTLNNISLKANTNASAQDKYILKLVYDSMKKAFIEASD
jgi:hypothetical protein